MSTNVNFQSLLDKNKLMGPNFLDWVRNLRIVLKAEKIAHVLDVSLLKSLVADASKRVQRA